MTHVLSRVTPSLRMNSHHEDSPRFVIENAPTPPFFHNYLYNTTAQEYWVSKAAPRFLLLDRLSLQGRAQQLTAINDELSALQLIMCAVRTRRNDLSPTHWKTPSRDTLPHLLLSCHQSANLKASSMRRISLQLQSKSSRKNLDYRHICLPSLATSRSR